MAERWLEEGMEEGMAEVREGNRLGGADRQPSDTWGGLAATYRKLRRCISAARTNFQR